MTPARRAPRGGSSDRAKGAPKRRAGGGRRKKGGRGIGLVLALLLVVAAGGVGLAMYFGFVPGPDSLLGGNESLPVDTALAVPKMAPAIDSAPAAPVVDSTIAAVAPAAASGVVTAADSAAGAGIYRGAGRCVGCHGNVGEGAPGLGSALRDSLPHSGDRSRAAIARVVSGGLPPSARFRVAMPAYAGQLAADDVARVAAYVFALSHPGGVVIDSAAAAPTGDPVNADARTTAPPLRPTVPPPPTRP